MDRHRAFDAWLLRDKDGIAGKALVKSGVTREVFMSHLGAIAAIGLEGRQASQIQANESERATSEHAANIRRLLGSLDESGRDRVASLTWLMRNQQMAVEFLGLFALGDSSGVLARFLEQKGLDGMVVAAAVESYLLRWAGQLRYQDKATVADCLVLAQDLASSGRLRPEHLVLALLRLGHNGVADVFAELELSAEELEVFVAGQR